MVTLIVVISLLGFFLLYNTSKKADLSRSFFIELWVQDNPKAGKLMGLLLISIALLISLFYFGIGSGIFLFFIILMTVASLVVLIAPLRYINYRIVSLIFLLSFLIELI
jgi:hypothetical protein